jgi:LmbE family N-acetylglucosaminyl deacetylase
MNKIIDLRTTFLLSQINNIYNKKKLEPYIKELEFSNHHNILIIAPHADDEVIGCGGVIQKYVAQRSQVFVLFITVENSRSIVKPTLINGQNKRILESKKVKEYLKYTESEYLEIYERTINEFDYTGDKIKNAIAALLEKRKIDTVYIPNYFDLNPDHRIICKTSLQTINDYVLNRKGIGSFLPALFIYEIWGPVKATHVCHINKKEFRKKITSMRCYKSQMGSVDYIKIIDKISTIRRNDFLIHNPSFIQSPLKYSMEFFQFVNPVDLPLLIKEIN